MDGALSAVDTRRIEIVGHLVSSHLILLVSASAVSPNARCFMPLQHFKQRLAWEGLVAPGHTIGRNTIDPNYLVVHLNAAVGSRGTKSVTTTKSHWECTCCHEPKGMLANAYKSFDLSADLPWTVDALRSGLRRGLGFPASSVNLLTTENISLFINI